MFLTHASSVGRLSLSEAHPIFCKDIQKFGKRHPFERNTAPHGPRPQRHPHFDLQPGVIPLLQSLPKDHSGGGIGKIEFPATAHRAATPSGNFDRTPQHGTSQRTRSGEKFQFGLLEPQRAAGRIFHFERQIQTHRTVLTHRHLFSDPDLSDQGRAASAQESANNTGNTYFNKVLTRRSYFSPVYICAIPKLWERALQSLNPASRIIAIKHSGAGNSSTEAGRYSYALRSLEIIPPIAGNRRWL